MDKVECPVCLKELSVMVIEEHVSRCLFLSEPSKVLKECHSIQKRPASKEEDKSPVVKKFRSVFNKNENSQNKFSSFSNNAEDNVEKITNINVSNLIILICK